ncbi:MAG: phage antirepressor N-terminal domain-containing protein [Ferribacterium limneticum]
MKSISINLNFSGAVIPVIDCDDGTQRVPLKPICDAVGVGWDCQRKKVMSENLSSWLGIILINIKFAGQNRIMTMIRIDRVAGFLNRINPASVRGAGNTTSADFLEGKRREWDSAIHSYEQQRGKIFGVNSQNVAQHEKRFLA